LPLALIVAALATALALGAHRWISLDTLHTQGSALDAFVRANFATAIALYILIYAAATTISLPGAGVLTISGGFLFGTWFGGLAAWTGATIGAHLLFLAARTALGDVLRARAGSWLERLRDGFRENAFSFLLVLRLTPAAPFFIVNVVPAFFNVRLRDYALATMLGMIPGALVYAAVGSGLHAALVAGVDAEPGETARAIFSSPAVYGPVIALFALALLPFILRHLRGRHAEDGA
jgi:uncharacterized membrane protein YdjX (TVP38/TMEM64 family)